MWKKIEELLSGGPGGGRRVKVLRWLVLVGLAGCALIIVNNFNFLNVKSIDPIQLKASPPEQEAAPVFGAGVSKEQAAFKDYETAYENKLRDILTKIVGVGDVDVLVTVDSTEELQVDKNTKDTQQTTNERDTNGATRHISDVTRQSDSVILKGDGDQPLVIKTTRPQIRGVTVVAKGAENATVKKLISDAVERGLGVPAHRISVIPRKQ